MSLQSLTLNTQHDPPEISDHREIELKTEKQITRVDDKLRADEETKF